MVFTKGAVMHSALLRFNRRRVIKSVFALTPRKMTPQRVLVLGFAAVIIFGSLILYLPVSSAEGRSISYIDALFTSTSAVCVTGLIVKDTPEDFSLFGQVVILVLIQVGGLGYMTSATALFLIIGKRIGLKDRITIQEALNIDTMGGLIRFTKRIVTVTFLVEFIGAAVLAVRFAQDFPVEKAVWLGIFHSVSAFNNAGFSLFSMNFVPYSSDLIVNMTAIALIVVGGIGFLVIKDVVEYLRGRSKKLSEYTRIVLIISVMLIIGGAIYLMIFEQGNEQTMGKRPLVEQVYISIFQSVSARTAGFNTVDIGSLTTPSLFLMIFLMYVGASSGSTGGGIKTGTFGVLLLSLWSVLRGRMDVAVFHRRISQDIVMKAFFMASLAGLIIVVMNLVIVVREKTEMLPALFEVVSAFGTVGLSTGDGGARSLSALFSDTGKIIIILTMFIGRLGPLTVGLATMQRQETERIRFPETKVLIG